MSMACPVTPPPPRGPRAAGKPTWPTMNPSTATACTSTNATPRPVSETQSATANTTLRAPYPTFSAITSLTRARDGFSATQARNPAQASSSTPTVTDSATGSPSSSSAGLNSTSNATPRPPEAAASRRRTLRRLSIVPPEDERTPTVGRDEPPVDYLPGNGRPPSGRLGSADMTSQLAHDQDTPSTCGDLIRAWRRRRHLSQLELANQVDVSTRHLSFVETGRAKPSREMVLHLAEHLDVPLRDRNQLLLSAGFAPVYPESSLHSPQMMAIRETLRRLLAGHDPYPAVVVDRWWNLVEANDALLGLAAGVARAPAQPADQRAPPEPAPRGHRAADSQPRRVAGPSARPAAPPGRTDRRPRAGRPAGRAHRVPLRPARRRSTSRGRARSWCRCASGSATPSWRC